MSEGPTPPSPPSDPPSPDRREQIIHEAARLFQAQGYHATSMEEIAAAVGLRKPTLYHYFGSKHEILFWLHEEFIDLLIARQAARDNERMAPADQLLATMGDVLELMETHRGHVRVFFEHHRELPTAQHTAIATKRTSYQAAVTGMIERAIAEGSFRPIDPTLATLAVFGACNWTFRWYQVGGALRTPQVAFAFWDLFVHGLRSAPKPKNSTRPSSRSIDCPGAPETRGAEDE